MSNRFPKEEKLKSEKLIERLFMEGKSLNQFPLRLIYLPLRFKKGGPIKAAVSVSKKNFSRAVDRNHIKRLLREAYRINRPESFNNTTTHYALMILYLGKDMPDFNLINPKLNRLLEKFSTTIIDD
ncbi:MAG: ribonuclease P protein component [Bacteroidia bacterium]|nr:ribonuclease P protein component [Bacteroidia bacterium]NND10383.1 ribonuclease P protein component [Flavobacteriaceae bacterium]MBT8308980.1 ribonuclease P protein component [Bacteroidia bacterium]NNK27935.1 ribonuclease P protein component [Flavobacteriaceae bacterium]NNL60807.1 ribonuclease P protein component [Flavobacteriaceae bacterium]